MVRSGSIGTFFLVVFVIIFFIGLAYSVPRVYTVGPSVIAPYPVFGYGLGPSIVVNRTTVARAPRAPRARR
jgi:hypothetical protein